MSNRVEDRIATSNGLAMPTWVRRVVFAVVGLVFAGGLYLIAVRGDVLLADLSALVTLICG